MATVQYFDTASAAQVPGLVGEVCYLLPLSAARIRTQGLSSGIAAARVRTGVCCHHTPPEKLRGLPKVGRLHGIRSSTRQAAVQRVVNWQTHNSDRLNSTLVYVGGMEFAGHGSSVISSFTELIQRPVDETLGKVSEH